MYAKEHNELKVYQIGIRLAGDIHKLIQKMPKYWELPESNQVKRSSSSVPANIAEGFGHRFYRRQFIKYLSIAIGSSDETRHHLELLKVKGYINEDICTQYQKEYRNLSVHLINMIHYLKRRSN